MKYLFADSQVKSSTVALFARAWIEIQPEMEALDAVPVALFARAWIEIKSAIYVAITHYVALFARAWIEISCLGKLSSDCASPSLRGRGLKSIGRVLRLGSGFVALFARAWIEMQERRLKAQDDKSRPLCEGVD